MGWFGMLLNLFSVGVYAGKILKEAHHDGCNKEKAKNNDAYTYIDSHGYDRLTSTGERVCYNQGKIYSTKTGAVLRDTLADEFFRRNKESLEYANNCGKKYVYLIYAKDGNWNNRYTCKTEISSMNQYKLDIEPGIKGDWIYYKIYQDPIKCVAITKQEFIDLGGNPPYISTSEFIEGKTKAAKELKKQLGRNY